MAYQPPAFFYYHAVRDGSSLVTAPVEASQDLSTLFDSRQSEAFVFSTDLDDTSKFIAVTRDGSAEGDAVDTIIISGHNFTGALLDCTAGTNPTAVDLLNPNYTVTEAVGDLIVVPLTDSDDGGDDKITLGIIAGTAGAIVPQLTELFFTTIHEMTRGPEPDFNSSWRRNQERFVNSAGVSSTQLRGGARKTYTLTWKQLVGADRQILLDLRTQTSDWSHPWFFRPPDDAFPTVLVELDRDENRIQDFDSPLDTGTSDRVTLNMIEVKG